MGNGNDIPVQEISELLEMVTSKVPTLIKGVMSALYSEDAGADMGKAVGAFYKNLKEAGISDEDAMKMTMEYMNSLKSIVSKMDIGK